MTEKDFDSTIAVDLKGVFLALKYELEYMETSGGGTIVNTASVAGLIADPFMAPYVAAKHGVVGLTKAAGIEYAAKGIRVNGIAPGLVETPMTKGGWTIQNSAKQLLVIFQWIALKNLRKSLKWWYLSLHRELPLQQDIHLLSMVDKQLINGMCM